MNFSRFVVLSYLGVMSWQIVWHGLLPDPLGKQSWLLVAVATVPLMFPLPGILKSKVRSMTWGAYLLVLYFVIAIMEIWSNEPERLAAVVQLILTVTYFTALVMLTRRLRHQA